MHRLVNSLVVLLTVLSKVEGDRKLRITQSINNGSEMVLASSLNVTIGNSLTLTCKHGLKDNVQVYWSKKDNLSFSMSNGRVINQLVIASFTKSDEGVYICTDGTHKSRVKLVALAELTTNTPKTTLSTLSIYDNDSDYDFWKKLKEKFSETTTEFKDPLDYYWKKKSETTTAQNICELNPYLYQCQNHDRNVNYNDRNVNYNNDDGYSSSSNDDNHDYYSPHHNSESSGPTSALFIFILLVALTVGILVFIAIRCCNANARSDASRILNRPCSHQTCIEQRRRRPNAGCLLADTRVTIEVPESVNLVNGFGVTSIQMCEHVACETRRLLNPAAGCRFTTRAMLAVPEADDLPPSYAASTANSNANSTASTRHSSRQNLNEIDGGDAIALPPTYEEALVNIVLSECDPTESTPNGVVTYRRVDEVLLDSRMHISDPSHDSRDHETNDSGTGQWYISGGGDSGGGGGDSGGGGGDSGGGRGDSGGGGGDSGGHSID